MTVLPVYQATFSSECIFLIYMAISLTSLTVASPPMNDTHVMEPSYFSIILSMMSCVSSSPLSLHRYLLWHPGHRHGQLLMLMARVTSSGISWKTMLSFTNFIFPLYFYHISQQTGVCDAPSFLAAHALIPGL